MSIENCKNCPFCGADEEEIEYTSLDCHGAQDWQSSMECSRCNARGPNHENEEAAIKMWNERK